MQQPSKNLRDEPLTRFHRELQKVKHDHRLLVLVTGGFIELLINALVDANCKNRHRITGKNREFSYSIKLVILHEISVLSDELFAVLNWFRQLRNRAAHDPFFDIEADDLKDLTLPRYQTPDGLIHLCNMITKEIWWRHDKQLGPIFLPSGYDGRFKPTPQELEAARHFYENLKALPRTKPQRPTPYVRLKNANRSK